MTPIMCLYTFTYHIYIYIYLSYCVGYRAIWKVIARVCEVLPEPKARVILTHECNNSQYCPINHVISCLLPTNVARLQPGVKTLPFYRSHVANNTRNAQCAMRSEI